MKLAIIGSRSIRQASIENLIPAALRSTVTEIITGGARGVDTLAAEFARKNGYVLSEFPPDYIKFKNKAPLLRNAQIVEAADAVLAIHDGKSRGTLHTIALAQQAGKPVYLITLVEDAA